MPTSSVRVLLAVAALAVASVALAQSQPPAPSTGKQEGSPSNAHAETAQTQPNQDARGSERNPVVVRVVPTPKTQQESANEQQQRQDQSSANWWMVKLTGAIIFLTVVQIVVNGLQAKSVRDTIHKMDEIASDQNTEMRNSIDQATRSAAAMERIAGSMAENATHLLESLAITKRLADINERAAQNGQRAFLSIEEVRMGNFGPGHFPTLVLEIKNVGHSPATVIAWANSLCFNDPLPDPDGAEMSWEDHVAVIFPDKTVTLETSSRTDRALTKDEINTIIDGTVDLAVYGAVRYNAGFGIEGVTGFGYNYDCNAVQYAFPRRFVIRPANRLNYAE